MDFYYQVRAGIDGPLLWDGADYYEALEVAPCATDHWALVTIHRERWEGDEQLSVEPIHAFGPEGEREVSV